MRCIILADEMADDIEKNIDENKIEFIYQEAKEYLLHTIDHIKSLRTKATLMLGFTLSVIAFAIPTIFQENNGYNQEFEIFLIGVVAIYIIISLLLIYFVVFPMSYAVSGNEPVNFNKQEILSNNTLHIKLLEVEDYQKRIDFNLDTANKINGFIEKSLYCVTGAPIISGMIVGMILLIH